MICIAAISTDLSLPATICSLLSLYFTLLHLAPLKLLAAVYLLVIAASVGFRLDTCPAALICFAAISIDLSLPATICRLLSPYYNIFHVAPLELLAAVYLSAIATSVGFWLELFFLIVLGRPECSVVILIGFASRCDY